MKKEGHFMASVASVYIGEWSSGVKQGYGVMDDIKTGNYYSFVAHEYIFYLSRKSIKH